MATRVLTPQGEDFPRWYQDVIAKAELADHGPVRGTMVIRPDGYAIWERMQSDLDARIKATGARNAYFPLFIPESYLRREADHVEGFSPELAVVTRAGGKQLEEAVVVRPTSETVIGEYLAKWVQSYRDLPLLLNQWANVVRWELRPRLLLRTSEFLWQEGHTAHASEADARAYTERIHVDVYAAFMRETLAMPVVLGRKSAAERFPGASNTLALEAMMRDGKALQMGTSHELGQNFAKAFGITYLSEQGREELAWTTSWGTSTRMLGGLIMCHGDDRGLRVPPRLAPVQVLVTIVKDGAGVAAAARQIVADLRAEGLRVELDDRVDLPFGRRAVDAELKGFPLRVEVGPRDLVEGVVVLARRIDRSKRSMPLGEARSAARSALIEDQDALYAEALAHRESHTAKVSSIEDAVEAARTGWATIPWSTLGAEGELRLAEAGVTVRCLTMPDGSIPPSEEADGALAVVGRAY
ncbi:MAG: proline--tRNA ligase [Micrococcales bacterium]|nr:proline--tRNA ligase [Micrococcales bacterium]